MGMTGGYAAPFLRAHSLKSKDYTTRAKESDFWPQKIQTLAHAHTRVSNQLKAGLLCTRTVLRLIPPPHTH